MIWNSLHAFLAMGGYGLYVWGSMLACLATVVVELVLMRQRRRRIVNQIRRGLRAARLDAQEARS